MRRFARLERAAALAALCVVLLTVAGCDREPPPPSPSTPEGAALNLFRLARLDGREDAIAGHFAPPGDDAGRAALEDALDRLAEAGEPQVVRVEPLEGLDRVVVDLSAPLPAGGEARYSVQLARGASDDWIVHWFAGPGIEWPGRGRPAADGLSTSAPPGD